MEEIGIRMVIRNVRALNLTAVADIAIVNSAFFGYYLICFAAEPILQQHR